MSVVGEQEILELLEPRFVSLEKAHEWYLTAPLPGFGNKTASQLIRDGRGEELLKLIQAIDMGIQT